MGSWSPCVFTWEAKIDAHLRKNRLKRPKIKQGTASKVNCILFNRLLSKVLLNKSGLVRAKAGNFTLKTLNACFSNYYQVRTWPVFARRVTYFIYVYVRMYICTYKTGIVSRNTRGSKRFKQRLSTQKTEITKQVLTMKLEAVCIKFRQAVDSGRINGHGRIVFLYLIFVNIFEVALQLLNKYYLELRAQTLMTSSTEAALGYNQGMIVQVLTKMALHQLRYSSSAMSRVRACHSHNTHCVCSSHDTQFYISSLASNL